MTPTALLLNLVVTGAALLRFGLAGGCWRLFLPFLLPAMPAAFLGGLVTADRKRISGSFGGYAGRCIPVMLRSAPKRASRDSCPGGRVCGWWLSRQGARLVFCPAFWASAEGFFLGPLILFLGWAGLREIAAMNSAL
jgi:hypothetical protein